MYKNKEYYGNNVGVIAKLQNPWNKNKKIVIISGLDFSGTKAGVIALTEYSNKILKTYDEKKDFYLVFKGLDKDGDGKIDVVKKLS